MKTFNSASLLVWALAVFLCAGCLNSTFDTQSGAAPTSTPTPPVTTTLPPASVITPAQSPAAGAASSVSAVGDNLMMVTVNGSLCGAAGGQYSNQPCTSVTICAHGTTNCQTIDNILVDTGSYGLRLFSSVIAVPTTPITNGAATLAECTQFGDGSSEWGPIEYVDVKLGNEPAVQAPIQVIDSTYATPPGPCTASQGIPDTSPEEAGFNGILGVGLFAEDCGAPCATAANNGQYYGCSGTSCSPSAASLATQVRNPVSLLPNDNNGVILSFPAVPASGATSVDGTLVLGIGTEANNTPSGVTTFAANANGNFQTVFNAYSATALVGFIDSGSSALFVPAPPANQLPECTSAELTGLFCPTATQSFTATNVSASGTVTGSVSFQIANASTLVGSGFQVFNDFGGLSGSGSNAFFDWGLPFFYGRAIYVGFDGASSTLGTGPYWAY